jgi:hypothetical protein
VFGYKNLTVLEVHMLECLRLAAKVLLKMYANTLKVFMLLIVFYFTYRTGIPPFTAARNVFASLKVKEELDSETKVSIAVAS